MGEAQLVAVGIIREAAVADVGRRMGLGHGVGGLSLVPKHITRQGRVSGDNCDCTYSLLLGINQPDGFFDLLMLPKK